ncbi:MAG: PfkB family carbohydrate kinase [Cyclobacteriaceae bacterium]|nr:D-glycero-beta-D-manno-heptose-7-phosphate kinase [Cyclobacteriaceae bacterium]MCH8515218.1 PfkB family carbohydrate kinase [Cyclobacteriaceae bacterium]
MTKRKISDIFQSFQRCKVLVIGDVMLDSYVFGKADRISPEAPVPVVSVREREKRVGGAANVVLNLTALGAESKLLSVVGDDEPGREFIETLIKHRIERDGVIQSRYRRTTVKERIFSGSTNMLRVDSEDVMPLNDLEEKSILTLFENQIKWADIVLIQDFDKGCITPTLIEKIKNLCKKHKILLAVDPKKRNFKSYEGVDLFKPNKQELIDGMHINVIYDNMETIMQAARRLQEEMKIGRLLVTLSERGMLGISKEDEFSVPAHVRSIADVSGASDAVISVALLATATKLSLKETLYLSNVAGGLICEHPGVVTLNKAVLMHEAARLPIFQ